MGVEVVYLIGLINLKAEKLLIQAVLLDILIYS